MYRRAVTTNYVVTYMDAVGCYKYWTKSLKRA